MNKAELIKKLERYKDTELITVLLKDVYGDGYVVDLEEVSATVGGGTFEILLIPSYFKSEIPNEED